MNTCCSCSFNYLHAQNTQKERNQHQNHSHIDIKVKQNCIISACPHHVKIFGSQETTNKIYWCV